MRIAVIGAGRVGTSLAVRWAEAGHTVVALSGRSATADRATTFLPGVPVVLAEEAAAAGEVVVLGVPDGIVAAVAAQIRPELDAEAWLVHVSGALGLEVLEPWERRVALHPLQTFPHVDPERLSGCVAAVTAAGEAGHALGERLARDAGAAPFRLRDRDRALYHAAAVFASNHVVATSAIAERLFTAAGVPDAAAAMAPLQRATIENIQALGAEDALTGPAVRGDARTIEANLTAVAAAYPAAVGVYVAMCRAMLDLAEHAGRLDATARNSVEEALAPWS